MSESCHNMAMRKIHLFVLCLVLTGPAVAGDELTELAGRYQIIVSADSPPKASWPAVDYTALTQADRSSADFGHYGRLLAEEFGKYPPSLVQLAHLHRIALVRHLSYAGQLRAALPDYLQEILYLDAYRGNGNEVYQRHVIHHEYYHLLEQEVFGSAYYKDPKWANFNRPDFHYGKGGAFAQTGPQYDLVHPLPGFINRYATSGLEEDKAEVFAALMVPEEARLLNSWSRADRMLQAKLQYMKAFLRSRVPEMNDSYWQKVQKPVRR